MIKTTPNQKVVKIKKEVCDKGHLYAVINLEAMEQAAQDLDAGAFKLWCYFAKNQDNYEFALSSKDANMMFGIKIKQYNNAIKELIEKGYLVNTKGNNYEFRELAVMPLEDNETQKEIVMPLEDNAVITKEDNSVITKGNKALYPLELTNITDNTFNNTKDITEKKFPVGGAEEPKAAKGTKENPITVSKEWLVNRSNNIIPTVNGLFIYWNKYYRMVAA